jgi:hypothetical protein
VPTLILSGREDLRTPTEDARRTAADYPNVRVLAVPHVGHSVLTTELGPCGIRGLAAFLSGAPVADCRPSETGSLEAAPFIPADVDSLPRVPRVPGPAGRTLSAALATITDAGLQTFRVSGPRSRIGGLRRGTATLRADSAGTSIRFTLTLRGYEVVREVRVSGSVTSGDTLRARLTVSGPSAAAGTVALTDDRLTGTLGGRRISLPA